MANNITLFDRIVPVLDQKYQTGIKTSVLETSNAYSQAGLNANEIRIPTLELDGLSNYSRENGYQTGNVSLDLEVYKFNYDRGKKFVIDAMDNEETAFKAFGELAGEFIRTKVTPESDAFRFSKYASKPGILKANEAGEDYLTGTDVLDALRKAVSKMEEKEVSMENSYLFISPTLMNMITTVDTFKRQSILENFSSVIKVPYGRFYTKIDLEDNSVKGFTPATDSKSINFMIIEKNSVIQYTKATSLRVFSPEQNQNADAWVFNYRTYALVDVLKNKVNGIYLSHATSKAAKGIAENNEEKSKSKK